MVEFQSKGFDGARVVRIAERTGITHQLITYHFGGKAGLFEALSDDFVAKSTDIASNDMPLVEAIGPLVRYASSVAPWAQALVRDGLGDEDHARLTDRLAPMLEAARERQRRGELPLEIDAGIFTLMIFAANLAPAAIPQITRALSSVDPSNPEFVDYYTEQLALIVSHLTLHK